jgi:hypothetical protein
MSNSRSESVEFVEE